MTQQRRFVRLFLVALAGPAFLGCGSGSTATSTAPDAPSSSGVVTTVDAPTTSAAATTVVTTAPPTVAPDPTSSLTGVMAFACEFPDDAGEVALAICKMDPASGEMIVMGRSLGPSVAPSINPQDQTIAYVCQFQMWSAHNVFPSGELTDLGMIGFARNRGGELCTTDDAGNASVVTDSGGRVSSPQWSPDGTRIVYSLSSGQIVVADGSRVPVAGDAPGLWLMSATERTQLTDGDKDDYPAWSPDGTKIAFTSEMGISIVNADGTGRVDLSGGMNTDLGATWSPDGSKLAFTRITLEQPSPELWVMNADGSDARMLYRWPDPIGSFILDVTPAWSPDGATLVFGATASQGPGSLEVLSIALDSGDATVISPPADDDQVGSFAPCWSPDGDHVLFLSDHAGGPFQLYTMSPDGSGVEQVAPTDGEIFDPTWT